MNRKLIALTIVFVLAISLSASYFLLWRYGKVNFVVYNIKPEGNEPIVTDVFENGQKIGTTNDIISLPFGTHTFSFDILVGYDSPDPVTIEVNPMATSTVPVYYFANYSQLIVITKLYNELYGNSTDQTGATILIDGSPAGVNNLTINYNENSLGTHIISSSDIPGYSSPHAQTANINQGQATTIELDYHYILTASDQHSLWLKQRANWVIGLSGSSDFATHFSTWVIANKVNYPVSFFELKSGYFRIYIDEYAGVSSDDRIKTLDSIYNSLSKLGINASASDCEAYGYSAHGLTGEESSIEVVVSENLQSVKSEQDQNTFYQFDNSSLSIPNLFPSVIPVGFAYTFPSEVDVNVLDSNVPMSSIYTDFRPFSGSSSTNAAGYYDGYERISASSITNFILSDEFDQIKQAVSTGIMSTALFDPQDFCSGLIWYRMA